MERYGSIETSDARYERDGIRHVTYRSPAVRKRQDLSLVLPEQGEVNLPLVLLLHGVHASHWAWAYLGGVHKTLHRLVATRVIPPMVLALPSDGLWGDGSGYLPHGSGQDYERLVVFETPEVASLVEPRITGTSSVFVAGLSMGGYGALRLGAKYCDRFAGICAHSAMTNLAQLQPFLGQSVSDMRVDEVEADVVHWIVRHRYRLPPIRFDCGTEDELLNVNRVFHEELGRLGIDHLYEEFPGGHTWAYWGAHIADSLCFFARQLTRR